MTTQELQKVEDYLKKRSDNGNILAERLLDFMNGKPDHVKDGVVKKNINYKILQIILHGDNDASK